MRSIEADRTRPAIARTGPLRLLPAFLFNTDQPRWLYLLKVLPLTLVPSLALGALLMSRPEGAPQPALGSGIGAFLMVVIAAPFFETLLMTPPVLLLNRWLGPAVAMFGSALLWGVLHSLAAPGWGLIIWWPFLIFSAVLLVWRTQADTFSAVLMVTAAHALHNSLPGVTLLFGA